jgi:hypothetical protein
MSLQQLLDRDPRLVALDVAETFVLLVVPAVVVGFGFALVGGATGFATGLFVGGLLGAVLARGRWTLQAERTEHGIERKTRPIHSLDPEENPIARSASSEYDQKYDKLLLVVLVLVGAGAFATVAAGGVADESMLWVVVVGTMAWTAALLVVGTLYS